MTEEKQLEVIDEIVFKKVMEGFALQFTDKLLANKIALLWFFDKIKMDQIGKYKTYMETISTYEWFESYIKTYNIFPTSPMTDEKEQLKQLHKNIKDTIEKNNAKLQSMQRMKGQIEKYKQIQSKVDMLDKVLDDIKKQKQAMDDISAQTNALIREGKSQEADKSIERSNEIQERISNLQYEKSLMSDEVVAIKKGLVYMDEAEKAAYDIDEYSNIENETTKLSKLVTKIENEITNFDFYLNDPKILIHNNFINHIQNRFNKVGEIINSTEHDYKVVQQLVDEIDLSEYNHYIDEHGVHRMLLKYAYDNIKEFKIAVFDEDSLDKYLNLGIEGV